MTAHLLARAHRTARSVGPGSVVGGCAGLLLVSTAWFGGRAANTSWHFFDTAARLVFGGTSLVHGHGLGVYAAHPKLQFGPLTILVAEAIRLVGHGHELGAANLAMGALGPVALWFALDTRRLVRGGDGRLAIVPAVVTATTVALAWTFLGIYAMHLDDALAVTLALVAVWGVARGSDLAVGLGLGLAVAAKPWAAAFLPLVLALPPVLRARAAALAVGSAAVLWLPFLVGAPHTAAALGHFTIPTAPNSALHALGVHDPRTPPWDRAAQLLLGGAAAAWCARHGRWTAVLVAAAAVRVGLDPATHRYYASGLVAFVLAWELATARWRTPMASLAVGSALLLPGVLHLPIFWRADLRLATCVLLVVAALAVPGPEVADASSALEPTDPRSPRSRPTSDRLAVAR